MNALVRKQETKDEGKSTDAKEGQSCSTHIFTSLYGLLGVRVSVLVKQEVRAAKEKRTDARESES
jgi:hypothetical protein